MLKKLCIISSYYPSEQDPQYAFVGTLVEQFADMGIECHVISPVSNMEKKHRAVTRIEKTPKGSIIHVYCPQYIQYPSRKIAGFYTYKFTVWSLWRAIEKTFKEYIGDCDAIYSHFIESGVNAAWLKKKTGIPAFMAVGESVITSKKLTYTVFKDVLYKGLDGIISVSTPLKDDLRKYDIVDPGTPVIVVPNGIDTSVFTRREQNRCRDRLGIKENEFVVSFVGSFIKRKGFDKVQEVMKRHPKWKCILIGAGEIPVTVNKEQIAFSGRISHNNIPNYICASDAFVLPTQAEGCCNAIIEAMGCGLPIVSSDRDFNYDILKNSYAILVDPENVNEIDEALVTLSEDIETRKRYAERSYHAGMVLSIENRAKTIAEFMEMNLCAVSEK